MPLAERRKRTEPEIPSASLADIAFLLLIFFLVATTIDVDSGIGMVLPPKLEENQQPPPIKERNMLKILVNDQGQVLVEDRPIVSLRQIRDEVKKHILNNGQDPNYAESPDKAIISVKTARNTPYRVYIDVLDEIKLAYREVRDMVARQRFGMDYLTYRNRFAKDDPEKDEIRKLIPQKISLAEPDPGTGGGQ
jgi:biopolymer transport protein ExbD|nr:MAG: biopolymer transporter ExbD [Bacteroidota bacterium]